MTCVCVWGGGWVGGGGGRAGAPLCDSAGVFRRLGPRATRTVGCRDECESRDGLLRGAPAACAGPKGMLPRGPPSLPAVGGCWAGHLALFLPARRPSGAPFGPLRTPVGGHWLVAQGLGTLTAAGGTVQAGRRGDSLAAAGSLGRSVMVSSDLKNTHTRLTTPPPRRPASHRHLSAGARRCTFMHQQAPCAPPWCRLTPRGGGDGCWRSAWRWRSRTGGARRGRSGVMDGRRARATADAASPRPPNPSPNTPGPEICVPPGGRWRRPALRGGVSGPGARRLHAACTTWRGDRLPGWQQPLRVCQTVPLVRGHTCRWA